MMPRNAQIPLIRSQDRQELFDLVPNAEAGKLYLITGERGLIWPLVQELTDHFAIRGPLRVVVGGNRFSFERLPMQLLEHPQRLEEVLDQVEITRGETCYQLLHALQKTPESTNPLIVMDILQSFYDENLTEKEVDWVLKDSIQNLQRISRSAPVLVSASLRTSRPRLLEQVLEGATHIVNLMPEDFGVPSTQPELF